VFYLKRLEWLSSKRLCLLMSDNQNSRPERMLDAGLSCPGTMLFGRGRDGGVNALPQRIVPVEQHRREPLDELPESVSERYILGLWTGNGLGHHRNGSRAYLPYTKRAQ
jgi:hypothetical protein